MTQYHRRRRGEEGIGGERKRREGKVQEARKREMGEEGRVGAVTQWWHIYLACKRGSESISSNEARKKR